MTLRQNKEVEISSVGCRIPEQHEKVRGRLILEDQSRCGHDCRRVWGTVQSCMLLSKSSSVACGATTALQCLSMFDGLHFHLEEHEEILSLTHRLLLVWMCGGNWFLKCKWKHHTGCACQKNSIYLIFSLFTFYSFPESSCVSCVSNTSFASDKNEWSRRKRHSVFQKFM